MQWTSGGGETLAGCSPDRQILLFERTNATADDELWGVSVEGGEPRRLVASIGVMGPVYSRDGRRIAYRGFKVLDDDDETADLTGEVIPSAGGNSIASVSLGALADHRTGYSEAIDWTPDGKALTFVEQVKRVVNVFRKRLDGGKPEPITHFTEGTIGDYDWSPDGRRLLVVRSIGQVENIWVTAADGSGPVQLTDFKTGRIDSAGWLPPDGRRIVFTYGQRNSDVVLIKNFR